MNGAAGRLFRRRCSTLVTTNGRLAHRVHHRAGVGLVVELRLVAVHLHQRGLEGLPLALAQRLDGPVLLRLEGADLPLALDDQPERHGLHPAGGESGLDRPPEDRARLVAHQPVEDPAGLLRVHLPLVDLPRLVHRGEHGVSGDLLEQHPVHRDLGVDLVGHVPGDRLALPVGVGGEVDGGGGLGRLLQLREGLRLSFNGDVLRLEPALHVHPQLPGGEVAQVPDGRLHVVARAEVLPDGLGLGGRLDDDERTPARPRRASRPAFAAFVRHGALGLRRRRRRGLPLAAGLGRLGAVPSPGLGAGFFTTRFAGVAMSGV